MELKDKLEILADAAKYDASCASSGAPQRDSVDKNGLGATNGMGICHSDTPDGRCVSLLKILLTNFCVYDCQYGVNRRTSNVPRVRFSVDEVARRLSEEHQFRGYIHLTTIPDADPRLIDLQRLRRIRREDLSRLRCGLKKLAPFVITADYKPAQGAASSDLLRRNLADAPQQMNLWPESQAA
jgi:predicted DNA-binding helix-hairpin-helix protein